MSESKNPEVKIKKTALKIIKEENIPDNLKPITLSKKDRVGLSQSSYYGFTFHILGPRYAFFMKL